MPILIAKGVTEEEFQRMTANSKQPIQEPMPFDEQRRLSGDVIEEDEALPPYPVGAFTGTLVKRPLTVMGVIFVVVVTLSILGASAGRGFNGSFIDLSGRIVENMFAIDRAQIAWSKKVSGEEDEDEE
mmetsp:Transcript_4384/g.8442  ORF Transcript_4384/g.8442 Transcript_4384/m.8442 type:complete len:128 (+) Transcript_4384:320-703(+)